ncbi:hypothetical protein [Streptomyces sp. NBC_01304]|nr:hypothetical protein OG430_01630 [Streptomyces sp. NBC_01304]
MSDERAGVFRLRDGLATKRLALSVVPEQHLQTLIEANRETMLGIEVGA